jgi:hypothetical protein
VDIEHLVRGEDFVEIADEKNNNKTIRLYVVPGFDPENTVLAPQTKGVSEATVSPVACEVAGPHVASEALHAFQEGVGGQLVEGALHDVLHAK